MFNSMMESIKRVAQSTEQSPEQSSSPELSELSDNEESTVIETGASGHFGSAKDSILTTAKKVKSPPKSVRFSSRKPDVLIIPPNPAKPNSKSDDKLAKKSADKSAVTSAEKPTTSPTPKPRTFVAPRRDPNQEFFDFRHQFRNSNRGHRGSVARGSVARGGGRGQIPQRYRQDCNACIRNEPAKAPQKTALVVGLDEYGPLYFKNFTPKEFFEAATFENPEARRAAVRSGLRLEIETVRKYKVLGIPGETLVGEMQAKDTIPVEWTGAIRTDQKTSVSSVTSSYTKKK